MVKKCPECGNPSYDGAPVCGNCGYKFPKPKTRIAKETNIFKAEEKIDKKNNLSKNSAKEEDKNKNIFKTEDKEDKPLHRSDEPSTIEIIKEKKLTIGIILIITIIVIFGIVISASFNNSGDANSSNENMVKFTGAGFTFNYPDSWNEINGSDSAHPDSVYFDAGNNTVFQYYNITSDSNSLKDITQERISYAQENGDYVDTVETITLDKRNASNVILEDPDGNYIRYVSLFSDGHLFVYKITGDSLNSVNNTSIDLVLESSHIA